MKTEPETFILARSGRQPLRFKGSKLAEASENGSKIALYRTAPDHLYRSQFVVHATLRRGPNGQPFEHVATTRFPGVDLATRILLEADLPAPRCLIEDL